MDISFEYTPRGMWEVSFWRLGAAAGHQHLFRGWCRTSAADPPDVGGAGGALLFSDAAAHGRRMFVFGFDEAVALLTRWGDRLDAWVLAGSPQLAEALCGELLDLLRDEAEEDNSVVLKYWNWDGIAEESTRRLEMPAWEEIASQYPARVASALAPLIAAREPGEGRLVLWHGAPGTGKTTALRALAHAWRDWAELSYVVDPEEFFGRSAYMTEVLMSKPSRDRVGVLVLEDAGELIAPDAREGTGQGLSRLLNLTDGLLGQGLDTVVLITTNEPLSRLHPAAARPGRCWAEVEFRAHTREEANRWLAARGADVRVSGSATLASLHALARGEAVVEERQVGFG